MVLITIQTTRLHRHHLKFPIITPIQIRVFQGYWTTASMPVGFGRLSVLSQAEKTRTRFPFSQIVSLSLSLSHTHTHTLQDLRARSFPFLHTNIALLSSLIRMMGGSKFVLSVLFLVSFLLIEAQSSVTYDRKAIIINGQRRILISGEMHYPRSTPDMWEGLVQKVKDGGVDVISTYVFWNGHEPSPGNYYFEGSYDLVRFIKTVQKAGLYVFLRIGPYISSEWNFGGIPVWLKFVPGIKFRSNNEPFKHAMQNFTQKIVRMMKDESLFEPQGGPIILSQIENESGLFDVDRSYVEWAGQMAVSMDIGVPWVMCWEDNAPDPVINAVNGFYADLAIPNNPNKPIVWVEAWAGWVSRFGEPIYERPAQDLALAVAQFFLHGGSYVNYYVYYGGSNFGRTSGGPFIRTRFDFDGPIDEYGYEREPKYGHLKQLNRAIKLCEEALVSADPIITSLGRDQMVHVYDNKSGACAAFLSNLDTNSSAQIIFNNMHYILPPWSISILPDCRNVVFNTATVGVQKSHLQMETANVGPLEWERYNEETHSLADDSLFAMDGLFDQLNITRDTTDYLWYITSVDVNLTEGFLRGGKLPTLFIEEAGPELLIFINGKLSGSAYAELDKPRTNYTFTINLRAGTNKIDLLSVSVGLPDHGAHFESWAVGVGGSVILNGIDQGRIDLTRQKWYYKIGLKGESMNLSSIEGSSSVEWIQGSLAWQTQQPLTWYRSYIDTPDGDEPLALDMGSMKKGMMWINGESLGRYYTISAPNGICKERSYIGPYVAKEHQTGCGQPTQRWYRVPRSWLKPSKNLLVIFEESGGDVTKISLVKVKRSMSSLQDS